MADQNNARENVNLVMTGILALGLLALFWILAVSAINASTDPPLQADPAPTAMTGTPSSPGRLPAQARGAFSTFDRRIVVVGLVSPLLTTIVGFYFGTRVSASDRRAAEADAAKSKQTATATANTAREVVDRVKQGEQPDSVLTDIAQKDPDAFARITRAS